MPSLIVLFVVIFLTWVVLALGAVSHSKLIALLLHSTSPVPSTLYGESGTGLVLPWQKQMY